MKYEVKYESSFECDDRVFEFDSEEEAEGFIDEDLDFHISEHKGFGCGIADFGNKTEFWVSDTDKYASWERLWK